MQAATEQDFTNFNFWFVYITSTSYCAWTEFQRSANVVIGEPGHLVRAPR